MVEVTQEELDDLKLACSRLWDLDENRLLPSRDYLLNLGDGKYSYQDYDTAPDKLFQGVKQHIWQERTFLIFYHLLDNYERQTGQAEEITDREKKEMADFLRAIMETPVMQYVHRYLVFKGIAKEDENEFRSQLYQMWFRMYRREGTYDTSGFEHVFVGELDQGKIIGLHNWIQILVEESKGQLDYMGFIKPRRRRGRDGEYDDEADPSDHILSIQFGWEGEVKDVSTIFIGTSPEFEIALYTLCFLAGEEENQIVLDGHDILIKCFRIRSKYGDKVGSVFPVLLNK